MKAPRIASGVGIVSAAELPSLHRRISKATPQALRSKGLGEVSRMLEKQRKGAEPWHHSRGNLWRNQRNREKTSGVSGEITHGGSLNSTYLGP